MTRPNQATVEAPASGGLIIFTVPRVIPVWAVRVGDQVAVGGRPAAGHYAGAARARSSYGAAAHVLVDDDGPGQLTWFTVTNIVDLVGPPRDWMIHTDAPFPIVHTAADVLIRERIEIDPWNPAVALSFSESMIERINERFRDPDAVVDRDAEAAHALERAAAAADRGYGWRPDDRA